MPDASLDDGLLDVVLTRSARRRATSRNLPKVFKGTHVDEPDLTFLRGREIAFHADRPFVAYADGDPIADLPVTIKVRAPRAEGARPVTLLGPKVAAAKAVGTLVRAAGRGGGTSLPGKVLTRLEPHAIGLLGQRLAHGSAVISATNGKTTTAAMMAAVLERTGETLVHNRAGANMAGGVASALALASRAAARARRPATSGCSRSTSSGSAPVVGELEPRALLLANLFRDQLDRYGELEIIAERWAEVVAAHAGARALVLNADDPLVADLGRRAARSTSASTTTRSLRRAPARGRLQALPPLRASLRVRGDLPRPPRPLRCPNCGARRPEPAVVARDVELRGIRSGRLHAGHAGGERAGRAAAARALQRLQRARRRGAVPAAGARRSTRSWRGWRRSRRRSAGRRPSTSAGGRTSILLVKNPAGRERGAAHAGAGGRASSTCSACSTTTPPTGATSRGCGTPTGSCSRRPCGG